MPDATIIPFELPLQQVLPTIEGNVDYRQLRDHLVHINGLLVTSGYTGIFHGCLWWRS